MTPATEGAAEAAPKARTYGPARCPECGETFTRHHHRQSFCCDPHKRRFHDRARARGQAVATLLQAWRLGRNVKTAATAERRTKKEAAADAFRAFCNLADQWNTEDREANRPPALDVVIQQAAMGFRDPLSPQA